MFTVHITLPLAISMLTRVVEASGYNHIAGGGDGAACVYGRIEHGVLQPVCIVGQMFHNMGLLGLLVNPHDGAIQENSCSFGSEIWDNLEQHRVYIDLDAREFLSEAQHAQDVGKTWGETLTRAIDKARARRTSELLAADEALSVMDTAAHRLSTLSVEDVVLAPWERELRGDTAF